MKKSKRTLMPKLRFPEFRDKGEWGENDLGSMTTKVGSGITPRGGDKNYRKDGRVFVRSQNVGWGVLILDDVAYIEEETHSSFDATEIKENDVLLNITGASIGRTAVADYRLTGGNVNQHVCIIRTEPNRLHPFLLNQYLISEYGQNQIDSFQAGGNRQGLNFGQIRSFVIPMPPTKAEQERIAVCLSSLDGLIAAEGQTLEALKAHKKGLMQQLFPQPGQTQPRLRFPEFQDKGEWGESPLGRLLSRKPEYGVNAAAVPFSEDLPMYIRITDIDDDGQFAQENRVSVDIEATEKNYLVEGDIVLARTGASVGKSFRYRQNDGQLVFAGFLIRVRPNPKKLVSDFLSNYLTTWQYWDWVRVNSARSGQPGINGSEYASMPVPLPPADSKGNELAEQHKIADCLTALNTQIASQTAKIETLKTYKNGLMQQLFPSPQEF